MALMIKEYIDHNNVNAFFSEAVTDSKTLDLTEACNVKDSSVPIAPDSLMVEVEGIHGFPHATRNFTRYMPECLIDALPGWTKPYNRPVIKFHKDEDGETIGRVISAEHVQKSKRSKTPATKFLINVSEEKAKQGIKDGRLDTVSISGMATDVRCSICGKQLADGEECEHERGQQYKVGSKIKTCYWDIYQMEPKELSYVIVPSDIYAKNESFYPATNTKEKPTLTEGLDNTLPHKANQETKEGDVEMTELEEAQAKVSELTAKVKELEEAAKANETKMTELTAAKEKVDAQVKELTESKTALEEDAKKEKELKEGLETELAETKTQLKESMIETLQAVRKATGRKEIDATLAKERSIDSIHDSIVDMKEEFDSKFSIDAKEGVVGNMPEPGSLKNPTLGDGNNDGKTINTKESVVGKDDNDNIDLKESMSDLLAKAFGARKF